jgi:hypothetical protein
MEYKIGSVISLYHVEEMDMGDDVIQTTFHTISVVDKILHDNLYCKYSICSVNGEHYKETAEVLPEYEGELADEIQLVDGDEFSIVIDSGLIPHTQFKNL